MTLKISVVIATHNRPEILAKVLESLSIQTLPKDAFEVILVEDFLNPKTKAAADKFADKISIKYYHCQGEGAGVKRNYGVGKSGADIILFLDDDMISSADLLEEHLKHYSSGADGVLGYIENDKSVQLNNFTRYLLYGGLQNTYKNINPEDVSFEYFYTGNISLKKNVFNALGGFDISFKQYGFEDLEFGYRIGKNGYKIKYNKDAVGYHHFTRNFGEYLHRKYLMGKSARCFTKLHPELKAKLSVHPRKLKEILTVNALTKNYWINKAENLEKKEELTGKEKKGLYRIYEYLLNYYYEMGTRG